MRLLKLINISMFMPICFHLNIFFLKNSEQVDVARAYAPKYPREISAKADKK